MSSPLLAMMDLLAGMEGFALLVLNLPRLQGSQDLRNRTFRAHRKPPREGGEVEVAAFRLQLTAIKVHIAATEGREAAMEALGERIARESAATSTSSGAGKFSLRSLVFLGAGSKGRPPHANDLM